MTSKGYHSVQKFVMTSKTRHEIKIRYDAKIIWHHFFIYTMCRSRVINDYVFFTNSVTLTFSRDNASIISGTSMQSFVTIGPHLTKLWCDIVLRTHRYILAHTHKQTRQPRHNSITITSIY